MEPQDDIALLTSRPQNPTEDSERDDDWVFTALSDDDTDIDDEIAYAYAALYVSRC